ncbi:hypothetical protein L228DRAFT_267798 [Xylona heveae TC161]|uniref:Ubiquitin-conjugating enzyme E2C-binding protein n=1 Tax=Xylona heveae (strain CBS 132557 / TC161) TaxID=1328760 RepID=A0A161TDC8_XYLHT|nr:hypothetical protein L228DRAFT_267798 [Xylona heveae TC161]KZF23837.1 hypothetical protein L228DRAFT_267798 [Xylona heveae TC161]
MSVTSPSTPYIYAELLVNIRQLTIYASLDSIRNDATKVELSSDRETITLSHDGRSATIHLPTKVGGTAALELPQAATKDLSFRLQIAEKDEPLFTRDLLVASSDERAPWPAGSLTADTEVCCRQCDQAFIQAGTIKTWKDLPSENWAEMMDFWHCHKPHDHGHQQSENTGPSATKGYSASNKLVAQSQTGFLDTCHFLFTSQDCVGVEFQSSATDGRTAQELVCSCCNGIIGVVDERAEGWRLFKWALAVRKRPGEQKESHAIEGFIAAQMLALIDSQAVRKFVVHCKGLAGPASALLCWVFTPDLRYSASTKAEGPQRAMKVFFKTLQNPENVLAEQNMSVEEIYLPLNAFLAVHEALESSNSLLPVSAQRFQDWCVGLLDRFDRVS